MALLLITGGSGFIGSHTCLVLLEAGHQLVVLDNFSNSSPEALRRVATLAELPPLLPAEEGHWSTTEDGGADGDPTAALTLLEGDIRSPGDLDRAFRIPQRPIDAVIHFAGLKAVGESVTEPLRYWDVNVHGSRCLLQAMAEHDCRTLVFSSSATLYGYPETIPIRESAPIQPINPYGHTKAAVEQLLADLAASADGHGGSEGTNSNQEAGWRIARLRYFNPVGAHPSGAIGEDPSGPPNNLFPFVSQVAVGRRERLQVFGSDWPTHDGTGVRDYIHVMDLAEGHRAALEVLLREAPQLLTVNLGSGRGHSVLDVVRCFEQASGRNIPMQLASRRPGDAATTVAEVSLAAELLDWRTCRSLEDICRDGWAWQELNPMGYGHSEVDLQSSHSNS